MRLLTLSILHLFVGLSSHFHQRGGRAHRPSPINALAQHRQLSPRQRDASALRFRPHESAASSIFLGGFKVQWHTLSRWFANVEIKVRLFVAFGVLLSPQYQQERRKLRKDNLCPVDLCVTSRTESDHQMQHGLARFPMMHSRIRITVYSTPVHRDLGHALAGHRNTLHPAVSACSRSNRAPGRGSSPSRRDNKSRSGPLSSKPYSFAFSLESFSRMNASISGALARMRSHCSL